MSEFDIRLRQTQQSVVAMWNNEAQLSRLQEDINAVSRNLGFRMAGNYNLIRRLNAIGDAVGTQRHDMSSLKNTLIGASALYKGTETKICAVTKIKNFFTDTSVAVKGPCVCVTDLLDALKDKDAKDSLEKRINDKLQEKGLRSEYTYEDGKWKKNDPNEKKKDDKKDADKVDIDKVATLASVEASASGALYAVEGRADGDYGYAEGSFEAGTAEVHATGYAGLYSVGPDGKKRFTPGVGGEIGVGVSVLTASGTALLGSDDLGVYVSGEASVGKAEAKIGGDIGLFDEKGKLNPQAQVSASAEAIAVEAEVTGGVKVAGVDINGSAGVNVGIGAHADIGIKNGKIKCDVGASLGVGVSLNFEIDAGKAVENAGKAVAGAGKAVKSAASSALKSVSNLFGW